MENTSSIFYFWDYADSNRGQFIGDRSPALALPIKFSVDNRAINTIPFFMKPVIRKFIDYIETYTKLKTFVKVEDWHEY